MLKKTTDAKCRSGTAIRPSPGGKGGDDAAPHKAGILVQDLGQLQRTCQDLESQLVLRTAEIGELKAKLGKSSRDGGAGLEKSHDLLDAIRLAQSRFIQDNDLNIAFEALLPRVLELSGSGFGFIGEVFHSATPYLGIRAIAGLAEKSPIENLFDKQTARGMELHSLDNLFGRVIAGKEPVLANDPAKDPRSGNATGQKALASFLGLPLCQGNHILGMVGLANRPGGYDASMIAFLEPFLEACVTLITRQRGTPFNIRGRSFLSNGPMQETARSSLGELTASIAHELNNPIYGIRNVLEKTKEAVPMSEKHRNFIALAVRECNRVKTLLEKLQNFHEPALEKREPVHIHDILDEMLILVHTRLTKKNIRIVKNYARGLPTVHAVADQLKQVILNLLQNAEDAMSGENGEIVIATGRDGNFLRFQLRDTGPGIPAETLSKLFVPFFTTKASSQGTGLGLSISSNIIHAHGGEITVTSSLGQGSEFAVTLPLSGA